MAYTPVNWQTGDTITADRLNRMDRGWGYESTELFSETVTAASDGAIVQLTYSGAIDAASITVNFDGTEYECENRALAPDGNYGAKAKFPSGYNFSAFPFYIGSYGGEGNKIAVETAGEHTVTVTVTSMQTSADFSVAVDAASTVDATMVPFRCVNGETTFDEIEAAFSASRLMYFYGYDGSCCMLTVLYNDASGWHVRFIPESSVFTAGFDENDVFTLTPVS